MQYRVIAPSMTADNEVETTELAMLAEPPNSPKKGEIEGHYQYVKDLAGRYFADSESLVKG